MASEKLNLVKSIKNLLAVVYLLKFKIPCTINLI